MSEIKFYSIGEVAKSFNISTRTMRYYDEKGLIQPARIDDNGYRFYTDKEIKKLRIIFYLKELGFSLKNIKQLMEDENVTKSLTLLIDQKLNENEEKIIQLKRNKKLLTQLKESLELRSFTKDNITEVTKIMENKVRLSKIRKKMWLYAILLSVIEILGIYKIITTIQKGENKTALIIFLTMFITLSFVGYLLSKYYYRSVAYVCPNCGEVFVPAFKKFVFAQHTPKFRKLQCPRCSEKSFCLEIAREQEK